MLLKIIWLRPFSDLPCSSRQTTLEEHFEVIDTFSSKMALNKSDMYDFRTYTCISINTSRVLYIRSYKDIFMILKETFNRRIMQVFESSQLEKQALRSENVCFTVTLRKLFIQGWTEISRVFERFSSIALFDIRSI